MTADVKRELAALADHIETVGHHVGTLWPYGDDELTAKTAPCCLISGLYALRLDKDVGIFDAPKSSDPADANPYRWIHDLLLKGDATAAALKRMAREWISEQGRHDLLVYEQRQWIANYSDYASTDELLNALRGYE